MRNDGSAFGCSFTNVAIFGLEYLYPNANDEITIYFARAVTRFDDACINADLILSLIPLEL